jgi:hypothetical protein
MALSDRVGGLSALVDELAQGQMLSCGVGECAVTVPKFIDGVLQTCTPGSPYLEVCDGLDNDCDGAVDENYPVLGEGCYVGYDFGHMVRREDGQNVVCKVD